MADPTKSYNLAITFTGLSNSIVAGAIAGGRCFIKNRNTREVKYYNATAKVDTTKAALLKDLNNFASYANGQVLEIGMMGDEYGVTTHTIDTTKGGKKITIAVTAVTTTTHPNVTL